jgi:hypothetical protein
MAKQNPLDPRMIDSACALHAKLASWRLTDEALETAARSLTGFGPAETLVKVVLVNSLYYTNVFAVIRVADHFSKLLGATSSQDWTIELVERLASVCLDAKSAKQTRLISLASKFAHFFLDSGRFAIYDDYAKRMLAFHTGRTKKALAFSYAEYCTAFEELARRSGVKNSPRRLDRYLWVQGQYQEYERKGKCRSGDLQRVFESGGWPPMLDP